MRKKRIIIILIVLAIIALILGIFLFKKNEELRKKIEIIDATYKCAEITEKFYEDDNYVYYFPCVQSSSVYVKFTNGNKMLVVRALEEEKVTIDELIDAGLKVSMQKK